jgi:hypothetical protein
MCNSKCDIVELDGVPLTESLDRELESTPRKLIDDQRVSVLITRHFPARLTFD